MRCNNNSTEATPSLTFNPRHLQLWNELCELCAKNPGKVTSLNVHAIIMQGIRRYSDQVGILWNSLADYYIRDGLFEKVYIYSRCPNNLWNNYSTSEILDLLFNIRQFICNSNYTDHILYYFYYYCIL